ncbi:DNA alkylation repair protein [Phytoactinopolyspora mesophila]|uniref:DNA alkylation repair protein n=1 Tax=Phytoactinopolyspora mesophila TaxID=2650750 RepID=A0A7K3M8H6_9ACTN|nr:DNA alkylation repair protein [Phytoactinopolyspora mesophila]NDL59573.1 DNA alkylation repair protein [Phytoactinopolyspora mesophila]
MAEPLKNSYGPEIPERIAKMIEAVHPDFPTAEFLAFTLDGYDELELTPRARRIADGLARHLPPDPREAIGILVASLGSPSEQLRGMEPFVYLPHVLFVAEHGLDCLEESFRAQYELTQRFTAEFSIRAFIERHPEQTLTQLKQWATDPSMHVRRLVSEGTRPRLPWAARLRRFQVDPSPVIELLEMLKDDPEEYVRRSVANNLNDIAKDHPDVVVEVCRSWLPGASEQRQRLIRHALRTLIKKGHPGALALLGFEPGSPATIKELAITPARARIGDTLIIEGTIHNGTDQTLAVLVDLRVHFVKANGSTSPKVFKGATFHLAPGETGSVSKRISLAQQSTRTHHPGEHSVEVLVNGQTKTSTTFTVE